MSDPELRDALAAIESLCNGRGMAYMASVSRLGESGDILVACTGGTLGKSRLDAQLLMACCETLTELRGLTVEDLEEAPEDPEDDEEVYH